MTCRQFQLTDKENKHTLPMRALAPDIIQRESFGIKIHRGKAELTLSYPPGLNPGLVKN